MIGHPKEGMHLNNAITSFRLSDDIPYALLNVILPRLTPVLHL